MYSAFARRLKSAGLSADKAGVFRISSGQYREKRRDTMKPDLKSYEKPEYYWNRELS